MSETARTSSDLKVRFLSAIVMLALAGGAVYAGGWTFGAFAVLVAIAAFREWYFLSEKLASTRTAALLWIGAGLIYIGTAAACLIFVREKIGIAGVVAIIGTVVATDVGAYFTGRTLGGPKIAPRISPSKTWSGLMGGMVLAGLFAAFNPGQLFHDYPVALFVVGAILAIVAQAGDFLESGMKRKAGVKDSGSLIPGHGGVLDRVDGMLPVAIVATLGTAFFFSALRF